MALSQLTKKVRGEQDEFDTGRVSGLQPGHRPLEHLGVDFLKGLGVPVDGLSLAR